MATLLYDVIMLMRCSHIRLMTTQSAAVVRLSVWGGVMGVITLCYHVQARAQGYYRFEDLHSTERAFASIMWSEAISDVVDV